MPFAFHPQAEFSIDAISYCSMIPRPWCRRSDVSLGFAVRIVQIELTSFLPVAVPLFQSFIGLHAGKLERFTQTEY